MRFLNCAMPFLLLPILAQPALAQKQFEGRIVMQMGTGKEASGPTEMLIKGTRARMNMSAEGQMVSMIIDHEASKMTMIMPGARMYMVQPLPDMDDSGESSSNVTRTGRKDVVAGHQCEIILVKGEESGTAEVCGATDMGNFVMGGAPGRGKPPAWAQGLESFFPLRVTDEGGRTVLEVTEIEAKPIDAAVFAPPAGYRSMKIPGS